MFKWWLDFTQKYELWKWLPCPIAHVAVRMRAGGLACDRCKGVLTIWDE